jgi:hypothetical protein
LIRGCARYPGGPSGGSLEIFDNTTVATLGWSFPSHGGPNGGGGY